MPPPKRPEGPITHGEARSHIDYDPETGIMRWSLPAPRRQVGAEVGWTNYKGYREFQFFGKIHRVHRFIFFWMTGDHVPEEMVVDHIDMDRSNNRWSNLRIVTLGENQLNTERYGDLRGIMRRGEDGFRVRLRVGGIRVDRNVRGTLEDAVRVRDEIAALRGGLRGSGT